MKLHGLLEIVEGLFLALALAGYVNLQTLRDVPVPSRKTLVENFCFIRTPLRRSTTIKAVYHRRASLRRVVNSP